MLGNLETKFDRKYSDKDLARRYLFYLMRYRKELVIALIAIFISTLLQLVIPFTLEQGVNQLIAGENQQVIITAIIFFVVYIFVWIADYFRNFYNVKYTSKTTRDIRHELFDKVQNHDLTFFDKNNTGILMSRLMDDTQQMGDFTIQVGNIIVNVLISIGSISIMLYYDVRLTLISLAVIPFLILLITIFRKFARELSRRWRVTISRLNESFQENISGISVTKSFGRIQRSREKFENLNVENYRVNTRRAIFFSSIFPLVYAISSVGTYLVLFYGGIFSITTGKPSIGVLVFFIALLQRFYFPIVQVTSFLQQFEAGLASIERVFSLMDVKSEVCDVGTEEVKDVKGEIIFDNISFEYEKDVPVYKDFTLKIEPGEAIALVGHTGSGKSSLISLLLRFYELKSGRILLDGVDIKKYKLKSYRSTLGMVLQDPLLFSGTIRYNIIYGLDFEPKEEEIIAAAKAANAWEFIERQPNGLDTEIRERGRGLSQGQRQLIAIARAFIINPKILLLDEATASIDAYSEALIQEAISKLLKDRTSIVIAHRLTTVKRADRIIVLRKGKVIESGNHDQLLAKKGHYSELYMTYFAFQEVKLEPKSEKLLSK